MGLGQAWCLSALALVSSAYALPAFKETFDDESWTKRWTKSTWKTESGEAGEFTLTSGKWYGDEAEAKGVQTGPDARFFAYYADIDPAFSNDGKDLVLQFSVKHEQMIDCGGGYIKLVPETVKEADMKAFSGDTPYSIMFGPDICGSSTRKVHVIINYKGENHELKSPITAETDQLSHVYTLVIRPDASYEVFVDTESRKKGTLHEDWNMLAPKQISDPDAKKPEDWDDNPMIDDPEDKKPADWDDVPKTIPDPEAKKPSDWDDDDDGEWTAPEITNPEWRGEWRPRRIENPAYKGMWKAPLIANPDFVDDPDLYKLPPLKYVAFELWQVKAGTIFDNIMVTDSLDEAMQFAKDTWGKNHEAEKAMYEKVQDAQAEANKPKASDGDSDEYVDPQHDEL